MARRGWVELVLLFELKKPDAGRVVKNTQEVSGRGQEPGPSRRISELCNLCMRLKA